MNRFLMDLLVLYSLVSVGVAQQTATAPARHGPRHSAAPAPSADQIWANLMAGNKRFVAGKTRAYPVVSLRHKLAAGTAASRDYPLLFR